MAQKMFGRFFSMKALIRAAFAAVSLSSGVVSAQSTTHTTLQQNGDTFNVVRGGGG